MQQYTTRYKYRTTPQVSTKRNYMGYIIIGVIAILANIIIASQPYQTLIAILS